MIEDQPNCVLCGNTAKRKEVVSTFFNSEYTADLAIYAESSHFIATPDLHPVIDDPYFLVYPKEHFTSFGLISPEWDREMHEMAQYLRNLCQTDSVIIFEHGQMKDGNKVKSVYHAHTHVIPTNSPNILDQVKFSINDLGGGINSC